MPFSPFLTAWHAAHINVELCSSATSPAYLTKYFTKGASVDRGMVCEQTAQAPNPQPQSVAASGVPVGPVGSSSGGSAGGASVPPTWYSPDQLASRTPSGCPPHTLQLAVGMPIMATANMPGLGVCHCSLLLATVAHFSLLLHTAAAYCCFLLYVSMLNRFITSPRGHAIHFAAATIHFAAIH